ncbi:MAG: hypothetical protein ACTS73_07960 [Arsenophonus sp. NEOnobi-MAG3]
MKNLPPYKYPRISAKPDITSNLLHELISNGYLVEQTMLIETQKQT